MFAAPKLTDAGKALYYENMGGAGITFTTIQMGKGTLSGSIAPLTALVDPVVTMDAAVTNNQNQYCDVSGKFSNASLSEGFYWREIGVFAADPDYPDDRSKDILYCYQNAYDTADFIPVASVQTVEKNITVPVIVGDAATVTCTLARSLIYASLQDLGDHDKDPNAHKALLDKINENLKNKQDKITTTGILKGAKDGEGNPTVVQAVAGTDYQPPTQELAANDEMGLDDTVPYFSNTVGQNKKVTLRALKAALGVQSASINVTTCAGASVTCTDGETTLNGVGSTKFSLPDNTGTWTVAATLAGVTVTKEVEVTGALQYNVDLMIATGLAVTGAPTKTAYDVGEAFDPTGLAVTVTYADNTTEDVTADCTFSPATMASDTTEVTITYQRAGRTLTATQAVTVRQLSGISVATAPTKTAYYIGETFDASGMAIKATMSDGSTKAVTGYTCSPTTMASNTTAVTISYTENGVTKTCTQAITIRALVSIAITTPPTKTAYQYGEKFSSAGMAVTATYNDNSTRVVSGWTYSPTGTLALSNTSITVSYTEGGVTKTTTQAVTVTTISTTLNANSWATIKAVSDASKGASYWAVGDTKTITINGAVGNTTFSNLSVDAFILGFNHNSSREGANRIHFKIGKISGVHIALCDSNYGSSGSSASYFQMNASNTNSGGWNGSSMRKTLLGNSGTPTSPPSGSLLAALPADLRAVMKAVTKYSDNTGGGSDTASYVTSTTDYLFLLSEFEYHGARTYANSAEKNYQAQYDYYKAGNSKIHYKHNATGTAAFAWCRSVSSSYSSYFCLVYTDGGANYYYARRSCGVAPGFAA